MVQLHDDRMGLRVACHWMINRQETRVVLFRSMQMFHIHLSYLCTGGHPSIVHPDVERSRLFDVPEQHVMSSPQADQHDVFKDARRWH
jgi:hypothetical protein